MRTTSIKSLRKKLWTIFSEYIRRRDKGVCFTCGIKKDIKKMQAGHYHDSSISNPELNFSEINVNCQCVRCNMFLSGNKTSYSYKLTKIYGSYILESLMTLKNQVIKWSIQDYVNKIKEYKEKLNALR